MLARRLLMASRGGGIIVVVPPATPPASGYTRVEDNPVMAPTESWEADWILEPNVHYEDGVFHMIYTGNQVGTFDQSQLGYATSDDGLTWTKYASNPIFGDGVGGQSGPVYTPNLFKVGSTYHLLYGNEDFHLCHATSTDLINWSVIGTDIISNPDGQERWNNSTVVIEDDIWHMVIEGYKGGIYRMYYWTSDDEGDTWTAGTGGNQLTDLQIASGGMWGGPFLWPERIDGLWHLWYHACPISDNIPTNIYHATSDDFVSWTKTPGAILEHGVEAFEGNQVADPHIVQVASTFYMFYGGDDEGAVTGSIGLATVTV